MVVIIDVDSALESLHFLDMDCVSDVSNVYSVHIFKVAMSCIGAYSCTSVYSFTPNAPFRIIECTPLLLLARTGLQPHPSYFDPEDGDRIYFRDIKKATYLSTRCKDPRR
jgi:hypothetical protein